MLSRVADSLFWLGRYIERAEANARILDVNLQLMLDSEGSGPAWEKTGWQPIISTLEYQTLFNKLFDRVDGGTVMEFVTFSKENPNSIRSSIGLARENARTVREFISSEMWERINHLYLWVNSEDARQLFAGSAIDFFRRVVDGAHQFHGTTNATVTHGEGWNFLQFGKYLERADNVSRILDLKYHVLLPSEERVGGMIDTIQWNAVLKSCSAYEAYRKLHPGQVTPWSVAEFIVLHHDFPRSVRFCVDGLDASLHRISGTDRQHFSNEAERLTGKLCGDLNYETIENIFAVGLHEYLDNIQGRLIEISVAMREKFCGLVPVE